MTYKGNVLYSNGAMSVEVGVSSNDIIVLEDDCNLIIFNREEAIAAAKAILKHFEGE